MSFVPSRWVARATLALATIGGGALIAGSAAAVPDVWSNNCTPDIVQIFPAYMVARCGTVWYQMNYSSQTVAYVDRVLRAIEAAELSGKTVQFRDIGASGNNRLFDAVALYR